METMVLPSQDQLSKHQWKRGAFHKSGRHVQQQNSSSKQELLYIKPAKKQSPPRDGSGKARASKAEDAPKITILQRPTSKEEALLDLAKITGLPLSEVYAKNGMSLKQQLQAQTRISKPADSNSINNSSNARNTNKSKCPLKEPVSPHQSENLNPSQQQQQQPQARRKSKSPPVARSTYNSESSVEAAVPVPLRKGGGERRRSEKRFVPKPDNKSGNSSSSSSDTSASSQTSSLSQTSASSQSSASSQASASSQVPKKAADFAMPKKQRRNSTTPPPHSSTASAATSTASAATSGTGTPLSRSLSAVGPCTKSFGDAFLPSFLDEKWAGPAYTNSPEPSSLPIPTFPLLGSKTKQHNAGVNRSSSAGLVDCTEATGRLRRLLNLDA